uniref:SJCHGC09840 protein n=1 Tax=Schistosoma japonicum TaxID=6182 RepID=Q5BQR2_SCHJA|nr:SJCHGC09840 protein [Schistosoma japonicum]
MIFVPVKQCFSCLTLRFSRQYLPFNAPRFVGLLSALMRSVISWIDTYTYQALRWLWNILRNDINTYQRESISNSYFSKRY